MKRIYKSPILLVIIAPFALLSPVFLTGRALFWGTPSLQFVPWWAWSWETFLSGHIPLWNPLLGMGAPLVASYQSALFYPPYWLYFIFYSFGEVSAMAWSQALVVAAHLAWAGWGMVLLTRRLGLGKFAQTICGLAFGLSGALVAKSIFPSINAAVAWMPWVLYLAYDLAKACQPKKIIQLGIVIGFQLLAGHAQTAWYTLAFAAIWMTFWVWKNQSENSITKKPKFNIYGKTWLYFGWTVLLGLTIAAVQLIPTAEYLMQSQRSVAVEYKLALTNSFWPWRLLGFLTPELFGNPVHGDFWGYATYWEDAVYIGLIPIILALGIVIRFIFKPKSLKTDRRLPTAVRNPRSLGIFLFGVIIISFVLAFGQNTPIFPWLYENVPTFDMFKSPTRISFVAVISIIILAGFGVEKWRRPEGRGLYWARLGTMGAFAVTLGAGLGWIFLRDAIPDFHPSYIRGIALAGFWALGFGALSLNAPKRDEESQSNTIWHWAAALWVAVDLIVSGWGLNPAVEIDYFQTPHPYSAKTLEKIRNGRLFFLPNDEQKIKYEQYLTFDSFHPDVDWHNLRAMMLPNLNLLENVPMVNNYDPMAPGRYANWMEKLGDFDSTPPDDILNLMDVSAIETEDQPRNFGVEFVPRDSAARVRWVPCAQSVDGEDSALDLVFSGQVNFDTEVILENADPSQNRDCISRQGIVKIVEENPNKIVIQVESQSPGWVVLSDVYYSGWYAWVDDEPSPIFPGNYLFRAVEVPAGFHEVVFAYRPASFYAGLVTSVLAVLGVAGFFIWRRDD